MFSKLEDYGMAYFYARNAIKFHPRLKHCYVRFWRWLKNEKEHYTLNHILYHIWNFRVRPPFWRWWCSSPSELGIGLKWFKRAIFSVSVLSLIGLFFYMLLLLLHFVRIDLFSSFKPISDVGSVWHLILIALIMVSVLLACPQLAKLRAGGYEMELIMPMPFEISPIQMESQLKS